MARIGIYFTDGDERHARSVSAEQAEAVAAQLLLGAELAEIRMHSGLIGLHFDNPAVVPGRVTAVRLNIVCQAIVGEDDGASADENDDGARELLRRRALVLCAMDWLAAAVESVALGSRGALALRIGGSALRLVLGPDDEAWDVPAWDLDVVDSHAVEPGMIRTLVCSAVAGGAEYLAVTQA